MQKNTQIRLKAYTVQICTTEPSNENEEGKSDGLGSLPVSLIYHM